MSDPSDASVPSSSLPHHDQPGRVRLDPQRVTASTSSPSEEVLAVADIQGNILAGFNKDLQTFLFLKINDAGIAKIWLRTIIPVIASVAEVLSFNRVFSALRARRGEDPKGLVATWTNIAFTFQGIKTLTSEEEANKFVDTSFRLGLHNRSGVLGDPTDPNSPGHTSKWVIGGKDNLPDLLLIVASDDPTHLEAEVTRMKIAIDALPKPGGVASAKSAIEILFEQRGGTRPDLPGHEHFGFKDGISQPGIRGRISKSRTDFLTKRLIDLQDPRAMRFSKPGQPLVWPGQFLIGYKRQNPQDPIAPVAAANPSPAWARNGAYLVVRRLRQDVASFWRFVQTKAAELAAKPNFAGLTREHFGALLVGRWASGAPLMRSPMTDTPALAEDGFANNHFLYGSATQPIPLIPTSPYPGDNFPQAMGDNDGLICPHAAHVRKINPRDLATDTGGANDTLTRLVLRRGIPFGAPMKDPFNPTADELGEERGLMFLCYQSSIRQQFEFLTNHWANLDNQPHSGGADPIIGEQDDGMGNRARKLVFTAADGSSETIDLSIEWIIPTGGGYFFAPSISALNDVLAE